MDISKQLGKIAYKLDELAQEIEHNKKRTKIENFTNDLINKMNNHEPIIINGAKCKITAFEESGNGFGGGYYTIKFMVDE